MIGGIIIGLLLGVPIGAVGILVLALCVAAGNDKEYLDNPPRPDRKE